MENDDIGQELQKQLEAAGKIFLDNFALQMAQIHVKCVCFFATTFTIGLDVVLTLQGVLFSDYSV